MKKNLFITGATGYIGTQLINAINHEDYNHVYCIGRSRTDTVKKFAAYENVTFIKADIFDTHAYSDLLSNRDIVIHLGAVTGKADPETYFQVNSEGTRILLKQCEIKNVSRFVFISSIAVIFNNTKNYYYAQSKREAEKMVIHSGLPYTILRPTIVIGNNASILDSFSKLAKLPIVPIFGDGLTNIQPIDVKDLAKCILYVGDQDDFINQTIELGGPEQATIETFIQKIHFRLGKNGYRSVHLPIGLIIRVLSVLEKHFLKFLPFTTGQLATFQNEGVAPGNPFIQNRHFKLKTIDEMLDQAISSEVAKEPSGRLDNECRFFTNYLINREPDNFLKEMYKKGHRVMGIDDSPGFFNSILINMALRGRFLARLADVYTSLFFRRAAIRKKKFLLLAIFECRKDTYDQIDSVNISSFSALLFSLGKRMICFIPLLMVSLILFSPMHAMSLMWSKLNSE